MHNLCANCQYLDGCSMKTVFDDNETLICKQFQPKSNTGVISYDVVTDGLKHDGGKPMLALVPSAIIRAVGEVMTHGATKYGIDSWKNVDPDRYKHAFMRHVCEWLDNPYGVDKDSKLPHIYHIACNVAFLLELDKE